MATKTIVGSPLTVSATLDVPVAELSGLAVARRAGGEVLVALGDAGSHLVWAELSDSRPGDWHIIDLATLLPSQESPLEQLEALDADGAGRVLVVQEDPARLLLVDPWNEMSVATIGLDASTDEFLAGVWDDDANSRVESLLLLDDDRAFVVKEKRPICFALFGTRSAHEQSAAGIPVALDLPGLRSGALKWGEFVAGEPAGELVAHASWRAGKRIERLGDISDAAVGPDGALYLLSDQLASVARIDTIPAPGEKIRPSHTWEIEGSPVKCEGLAFDQDGTCFIGIDRGDGKANLLVIAPWAIETEPAAEV